MNKILWDIDGTLLNFDFAETRALKECFKIYKLGEVSNNMIGQYKAINKKQWESLEKGLISRKEVMFGRFEKFFELYGIDKKLAGDFNRTYQEELGKTYVFNDYGLETVKKLKNKYEQYAVTNGSFIAQKGKLEGSGLIDLLDDVFISEIIGYEKPDPKFFSYIFEKLGSSNKDEYVIIGDSLTSDMLGGKKSGIRTIWFNPFKLLNNMDFKVDYEITCLKDVEKILLEIFE